MRVAGHKRSRPLPIRRWGAAVTVQPGEGEDGRIEDIMSRSHQCFLIAALRRIRRQFKTLRRRQPSRRGGFARHNGGDGERRFPSAVGGTAARVESADEEEASQNKH